MSKRQLMDDDEWDAELQALEKSGRRKKGLGSMIFVQVLRGTAPRF